MSAFSVTARYALVNKTLDLVENVEILIDGNGVILEINDVSEVSTNNLVVPGFYNAHTHAGDNGIRDQIPEGATLEELVGDNSIKQNYLDSMTVDDLEKNLLDFINDGRRNFVTLYNDFREDGVRGTAPYLRSPVGDNVTLKDEWDHLESPFVSVLSRPANVGEAAELAKHVGFGIRDIYYYTVETMMEMKSLYFAEGQPLQIHTAEDGAKMRRWEKETGDTDITWSVKNLEPEMLIHTNHADEADYQVMKDNSVPVAICPTSNQITDTPRVKVELLEELDFPHQLINMGSDNGMFQQNTVMHELQRIRPYVSYSFRQLLEIAMIPEGIASVEHLSCLMGGKTYRGTSVDLPSSVEIRNHTDVYHHLTNTLRS